MCVRGCRYRESEREREYREYRESGEAIGWVEGLLLGLQLCFRESSSSSSFGFAGAEDVFFPLRFFFFL